MIDAIMNQGKKEGRGVQGSFEGEGFTC